MYCVKCGKKLEEGVNFCPSCGENINNNHSSQFTYSSNYSNINSNDTNIDHQNQYEYGQTYNNIGSEGNFLEVYVGNNYEKIKNNKFSIPTFIFGGYYLLYRKLWLHGILLCLLPLLSLYFAEDYIAIIIPGIQIIMALNFSKIYLQSAEKKVNDIKQKNLDKSTNELLTICKNKGGVSIAGSIIGYIIICIISVIFVFYTYQDDIIEAIPNNNDNYYEEGSQNNNDLNYIIPQGFEGSNSKSSNYKSYFYSETDGSCHLEIYAIDHNIYDNEIEYLNENVLVKPTDTVSNITNKNINGETWKYLKVTSNNKTIDAYAISKGKNIYFIEFTDNMNEYNEGNVCPAKYNEFINSVSFERPVGGNSV